MWSHEDKKSRERSWFGAKKLKEYFKCRGSKDSDTSHSGYRYKPLRNLDESCTFYEPEKTSVGEFLNKNSSLRAKQNYGSTVNRTFVDRFGRRSRDSLELSTDDIRFALSLPARKKRQVIELKEFPLGYSKSYLNVDLDSQPSVVYDPCGNFGGIEKTDWRRFSETESETQGCFPLCPIALKRNSSEGPSQVSDLKKSSRKLRFKSSKKPQPKVVHFFPSSLRYDTQFVQTSCEKTKLTDLPERGPKGSVAETTYSTQQQKALTDYGVSEKKRQSLNNNCEGKDRGKTVQFPARSGGLSLLFVNPGNKEHVIDFGAESPEAAPREDPVKLALTRDECNLIRNEGKFARDKSKLERDNDKLARDKDKITRDDVKLAPDEDKCTRDETKVVREEDKLPRDSASYGAELSRGVDMEYKADVADPLAGISSPIRQLNRQYSAIEKVPQKCSKKESGNSGGVPGNAQSQTSASRKHANVPGKEFDTKDGLRCQENIKCSQVKTGSRVKKSAVKCAASLRYCPVKGKEQEQEGKST